MLEMDPRELLRGLFTDSHDGLLILDPASLGVLECNPAMQRLTRMSRKELLAATLEQLVTAQGEEDVNRLIKACETTCFFHAADGYELRRIDGPPLAVNVSVNRLHTEERRLAFVTLRDVHERVEAQRALEESELRYRQLLDQSGYPIALIDLEGRFLYVNTIGAANLGTTSQEAAGRRLHDFFPPTLVAGYLERFQTVVTSGTQAVFEDAVELPGGTRWFWSIMHPLFDSEHQAIGVQIVSHDITDRKSAEQQLIETNQELTNALSELRESQQQLVQQERLRVVGQLASGVAHDLNNLLTPVLANADALLASDELTGNARELVTWISMAAHDAAGVVDRLSALYRPPSRGRAKSRLDPRELVTQIAELTRPKWKDEPERRGRRIQLDLELQPAPPVLALSSDLRQVLSNLVFNAVDAMPEGGTLTLSTATLAADDGDLAVISVRDTGHGMTPDQLARCCEPFYTTREGGTGLGLNMCQGMVRSLGGELEIVSHPSSGTAVTIRLPAATGDDEPDSSWKEKNLQQTTRVLFVDDDPAVRRSVAALFRVLRIRVDLAASGAEALEALSSATFDVVVTDLGMPAMDGQELVRLIRLQYPALKVVLLSGWTESVVSTDDEFAPHAVLMKPLSLAKLRKTLNRLLEG